MIIARLLRNASIVAGDIVAGVDGGSGTASAQVVWGEEGGGCGGGGTVGGSGRELVRFTAELKKGKIVVSFGDRRLYFVTSPGQAISYPIAIPREESRWAGVTSVTSKRINPSWTPTPTMMAEN